MTGSVYLGVGQLWCCAFVSTASGVLVLLCSTAPPVPHHLPPPMHCPHPCALQPAAGACPPTPPRVVLVCGADVLHSMADPTLWRQDLLEVSWTRPSVCRFELSCTLIGWRTPRCGASTCWG